ncbi:amidohydrolase family protein [Flammeovirga aprica]|uniref:Amidohydrolase family protein n=1 Tax=Flammeovirga aprica JL-4 TaxID=694437 RepID=A0A7X9P0H9_9BACT|nr:amidohydrolase family protein [Flammeovirga aprica]NME67316.1 amidohydrolase family protein [Flammeovirga aprica JL-4]
MKKTYYIFSVICGLLLSINANAQVPTPAKAQSKGVVLKGGEIHDGLGKVIPNAVIAFNEGKITFIGESFSDDSYEVIDISGQKVYPGFVLPTSELGLVEIEAVSASNDNYETGKINPEVRSVIAYNTDSHVIPTVRSNGVLVEQVMPKGGIFSGRSSVVQLDAWNWEDALIKENDAQHLRWPRKYYSPSWTSPEKGLIISKSYHQQVALIEKTLRDAEAYSQGEPTPVPDFPLEAMKELFSGKEQLFIHVDEAKSIVEAVKLAQKYNVKNVVVVGGTDAWLVADFLKSNAIPVLMTDVHSLPVREQDDVDLPYKRAKLLQDAGLIVGLTHSSPSNSRNLPFYAGTVAAYGVEKEDALKMITSNTAKILGIEKQYGSLEVGKSATIIVSEGDVLDMRTSKINHAFIDGRQIDLNNKHSMLYKKFKGKYDNQ